MPLFAGVSDVSKCPSGWKTFQGACYSVQTEARNWFEAEKQCAVQGGYLASCLTKMQHYMLAKTVGSGNFWIGGNEL